MRRRSICRCCHRLRAVDDTRCCAGCAAQLEKMRAGAPLRQPVEVGAAVQATETEERDDA